LFGGQGRVIEGSAQAVIEGDKAAAAADVAAIRAGASSRASAQRTAGRVAKYSAIGGGILQAGSTYAQYSQVK